MKAALKFCPWLLVAGLCVALWFTSSDLAQSISAHSNSSSSDQGSSAEIQTRGSWICESESCGFRNLSNGKAFRSAVPQACPFCAHDLKNSHR